MELKIIEETSNKLVFEMVGVDHTLANLIRDALWNESDVKVSGYNINHPLKGTPKFIIETAKKNPKDALLDAIKKIKKDSADLAKAVAKI